MSVDKHVTPPDQQEIIEFFNRLSPEQHIELTAKFNASVEEAHNNRNIEAFLEIEKILEDRGLDIKGLTKIANHVEAKRSKKFSDGNGNFWSGRGKRPNWVAEALSEGEDISVLAWEDKSLVRLNERDKDISKVVAEDKAKNTSVEANQKDGQKDNQANQKAK